MLHTSLRQFPGKSKEHHLLWNWLYCNKPFITSGKEFCIFYRSQTGPIEVKYSFTTDLFEILYLSCLISMRLFLMLLFSLD